MKILNLLLLFLIFIGTLYCIRSLRALHGKVSKKSEQISREINKAALEGKKLSMTAYRQTEAFIQLTNLLQFKSAIPPTRSWLPHRIYFYLSLKRSRRIDRHLLWNSDQVYQR